MSKTIFSQIIDRELPGHFIYEDEVCVVILDKFPAVRGQALVIPRDATDYAFDLDDTTYQHLFAVTKRVAKVLDAHFNTERTCLVLEGFDVPHAHIKLYPVPDTTPLGQVIGRPQEASDEELAALASELKSAL